MIFACRFQMATEKCCVPMLNIWRTNARWTSINKGNNSVTSQSNRRLSQSASIRGKAIHSLTCSKEHMCYLLRKGKHKMCHRQTDDTKTTTMCQLAHLKFSQLQTSQNVSAFIQKGALLYNSFKLRMWGYKENKKNIHCKNYKKSHALQLEPELTFPVFLQMSKQ